MFRLALIIFCCLAMHLARADPFVFEAASLKPSRSIVGNDGEVAIGAVRFTARNATLKRLIHEAYGVPYSRIAGGPRGVDTDEYDIEATAGMAVTAEQMRLMLRGLLADRLRLAVHTETRELRGFALVVGRGGPKLRKKPAGSGPGTWRFHGTLSEFADRLSIALAIPVLDDPTVPSHPAGPPVAVVNRTGIEGEYEIDVDFKPEAGMDPFTLWQRVLQDQLGLKLEGHPVSVTTLVIDHADKIPVDGN